MSCLWQSSKIPGFCHKKDIMIRPGVIVIVIVMHL